MFRSNAVSTFTLVLFGIAIVCGMNRLVVTSILLSARVMRLLDLEVATGEMFASALAFISLVAMYFASKLVASGIIGWCHRVLQNWERIKPTEDHR